MTYTIIFLKQTGKYATIELEGESVGIVLNKFHTTYYDTVVAVVKAPSEAVTVTPI